PQDRAVPDGRTFLREQFGAHERVDAVGADQHVAARGSDVAALAVEEIGRDAGLVLHEMAEAVASENLALAETGASGLVQHALQATAVDRELRHLEAGSGAAQFVPYGLAGAVGVEQFVGAD